MNEELTFWTLNIIFINLLPDNFFEFDEFLNQEHSFLKKIIESNKLLTNENNQAKIDEFLSIYLKYFWSSLFVDILSVQTTYFIWDNLFSKGNVYY